MPDAPRKLYEMPREGDLFAKIIGSGDRVEVYFARANVECTYDRKTLKVETWYCTLLWGVRVYWRFSAGMSYGPLSDWQPYDPEVHGKLPSAPRDPFGELAGLYGAESEKTREWLHLLAQGSTSSRERIAALEAQVEALEAQVAALTTPAEEPPASAPSETKPPVPLRRQRG
jgi:hypothetical protein